MPDARLGDRSLFPRLEARAYLAHAAISPPSLPVASAVAAVTEDYAARGMAAFLDYLSQREALKVRLAEFVGARGPETIGLLPNTTRGVQVVAECFPWSPGDKIVAFDGEFPTNVTPWQQAAAREKLELVMLLADSFRPGGDGLGRLERELQRGTKLVAVSAVQFQSGLRMPIRAMGELVRRYDARLFVDAIQACAVVPLDVEADHVDYMTCGGHKWLMGSEGTGFFYVAPERHGELLPYAAGWLSHEEPVRFLLEGAGHLRYDRPVRQDASFVEAGGVNTAGFVALDVSLSLLESLGTQSVFGHVDRYNEAVEAGLVARGFRSRRTRAREGRSGILSLEPPPDVDIRTLGAVLAARGEIVVSIPDGLLRLAPHWPNALAEVPVVLDCIDAAIETTAHKGSPVS